ncbi:hypothetical protein PanWU01x14_208720 [Parasponia andersonii]|uniref:Uncharacterized protein n=1 Tax=Parasponia andersonii TaxID=3476 RepID=A0A2P5BUK4_PARAD|nr:hypothetical protein PanWU01x14_208720 [Parasponia andersonii]
MFLMSKQIWSKDQTCLSCARKPQIWSKDDHYIFRHPGILTYVFEIIFQMNAGAVMLTDSVYWFIIFPFLTIQDYNLNFMTVDMHTVNVIFTPSGFHSFVFLSSFCGLVFSSFSSGSFMHVY